MKTLKKWRSAVAALAVAVAGTTVLVVSSSSAAEPQQAANHWARSEWVGSWATALTAANASGSTHEGFTDQTARMIVHLSVGGDAVRIRLSNLYGEKTVKVGHATVAMPETDTPEQYDVEPGTLRELTFNGKKSTAMLKGTEVFSDPVRMRVPDLSDLVVTVYFPQHTGPTSFHATTRQHNYFGDGDLTKSVDGTDFTTERDCCWSFLSGVDTLREYSSGSVAVLGDSIADGFATTINEDQRWPDLLAERLVESSGGWRAPGVLNLGISGSRLSYEGTDPILGGPGIPQLGANSQARLNEDIFAQTGVDTVILALGVNDIWMNGAPPRRIINAILNINTQVQQKGIRLLVATISPYQGYPAEGAWTPEKEQTRIAVNEYLRSHKNKFDGLIDFDRLLDDGTGKLRAEFDSGDHIHPNDAGNQAMADLIPLYLVR